MVTRETLKLVIDQYLAGDLDQEQISGWAYDLITTHGEPADQLVTEVLYNLVSFHDVGLIFEQYRPSREKLEYFKHWLDGDGQCNWDDYTSVFDPGKLS